MSLRTVWPVAVALAISLFVFLFQLDSSKQTEPNKVFAEIIGHPLPSVIKATRYKSKLTDNFFHQSHYWLLAGAERDFRSFALSEGFVESSEDARFTLPNLQSLFGIEAPPFLTGYEKDDTGRNQWLLLFRGAPIAVYVY